MPDFTSQQTVTATRLNEELRTGRVLARGRRTTSSSAATGTTAVAVLRLDDISIAAGKLYRVATGSIIPDGTTTTDVVRIQIHYTTDGSTPTTSSAVMDGAVQEMQVGNATNTSGMDIETFYAPASNETLSLLLAFRLVQGTGSTVLFAGSGLVIDMYLQEVGDDPGDTGVDL